MTVPNSLGSEPKSVAELGQILLVEAVFRHRTDPLSTPPDKKLSPQRISVQINVTPFAENGAVGVRVILSTDFEEEGALYDFAVTMAGVLSRTEETPAEWTELEFAEMGASMLYPFVREAVANITGRGRFGPVWLNPFNVQHAFLEQRRARENSKQTKAPTS